MDYSYTKSNRLIEFNHKDKNFTKFCLLKCISLIIDYLLVVALQLILLLITNLSWILLGLITMLYLFSYTTLTCLIWGKTIGLVITKLTITNRTGFLTSKVDLISRSALTSIYGFPIIGWALMATNILTAYFWKGITLLDFLSRTTVITNHSAKILLKAEKSRLAKIAKEEQLDDLSLSNSSVN